MVSSTLTAFMTVLSLLSNSFMYLEIYKVWRRQSHDDISFLKILFGVFSTLCWSYYGTLIKSLPLIVSSFSAFIGFLFMLTFKLTIPSKSTGAWRYV